MRKGKTFIDWHNVGNTIPGVQDNTSGTTRSVERQHGLNGDVEGRSVEGLEDDLGHLLPIGFGVDGRFGEQDRMLFRGDTELVVKGVVPYLFHVIPVCHDTMLDGVSKRQDATLGLCFIPDIGVFLAHTNHDTVQVSVDVDTELASCSKEGLPMVTRPANNGSWSISAMINSGHRRIKMGHARHLRGGTLTENCSWGIVTGKTSLAHTRARPLVSSVTTMTSEEGLSRCSTKLQASLSLSIARRTYPLSMTRAATSSVESNIWSALRSLGCVTWLGSRCKTVVGTYPP